MQLVAPSGLNVRPPASGRPARRCRTRPAQHPRCSGAHAASRPAPSSAAGYRSRSSSGSTHPSREPPGHAGGGPRRGHGELSHARDRDPLPHDSASVHSAIVADRARSTARRSSTLRTPRPLRQHPGCPRLRGPVPGLLQPLTGLRDRKPHPGLGPLQHRRPRLGGACPHPRRRFRGASRTLRQQAARAAGPARPRADQPAQGDGLTEQRIRTCLIGLDSSDQGFEFPSSPPLPRFRRTARSTCCPRGSRPGPRPGVDKRRRARSAAAI